MSTKTILTALTILLGMSTLLNGEIDSKQAVRAMVGEASNQGYRGLLAVGCVIRHRGSIQGLYGAKAAHCDREPAWVWNLARKAWKDSETTDPTGGATHFENLKLSHPYWADSMTKTVKIGDHQFYK